MTLSASHNNKLKTEAAPGTEIPEKRNSAKINISEKRLEKIGSQVFVTRHLFFYERQLTNDSESDYNLKINMIIRYLRSRPFSS